MKNHLMSVIITERKNKRNSTRYNYITMIVTTCRLGHQFFTLHDCYGNTVEFPMDKYYYDSFPFDEH